MMQKVSRANVTSAWLEWSRVGRADRQAGNCQVASGQRATCNAQRQLADRAPLATAAAGAVAGEARQAEGSRASRASVLHYISISIFFSAI